MAKKPAKKTTKKTPAKKAKAKRAAEIKRRQGTISGYEVKEDRWAATGGMYTFGRPVEYSPELVAKGYEYLESCVDSKKKIGGLVEYKVKVPTYEGLGLALGICKRTVIDWATKYTDFSQLTKKLLQLQAEKLMSGGLSGNYNPTIAKVLLSKHGYREVTEQEQTVAQTIKFEGIEVVAPKKPDEA
jgi:hypothetical protein